MGGKSALVVGVSGLVGGELLEILLNAPEYLRIVVFVRKPLGLKHPKLEEHVVDFEALQGYQEYFKVTDVFCCLGTTIKKAGSQQAFRRVDVDYPLQIAKLAKEMGAERFLVISSMGAAPHSRAFYTRMKGILEEQLKTIGFTSLHFFRPSLLLGKRKEFRLGEAVFTVFIKAVPFIFLGSMKKYKPIEAKVVARGMYRAAQQDEEGVSIYLSHEISEIG